MEQNYHEVESQTSLRELMLRGGVVRRHAFQNLDFTRESVSEDLAFEECIFLGCALSQSVKGRIAESCYILPRMESEYNPFRSKLYSAQELYAGFDRFSPESYEDTFDSRVYKCYMRYGRQTRDISRTLMRTLHDHSITNALNDMIGEYEPRQVVAVMGGHAMRRDEGRYLDIAHISKSLTERGLLIISGGGPGAMEAAHLGAWMAGREDEELCEAVRFLSSAPTYKDRQWLSLSFKVMERYPRRESFRSIGIPTWFYGHEPATPFASHIAKYFDNSIREDGLLALAKGGVIYSPGSAGTMQEIFQDAAQNHYLTFDIASPMVFLGREYWAEQMPIYDLLQRLHEQGRYQNLKLMLADEWEDVVRRIEQFSISGE